MNPLKRLKLYFNPPKIDDPDFGQLRFMYISNHPEQSYWEAEYLFHSGQAVGIRRRMPAGSTGRVDCFV